MAKSNTDKKPVHRVIAGDSVDLNPYKDYDNVGWRVVSDVQDYDVLQNEMKHDGLAHRIVTKPAEDATRNGFRVVIEGDPDKSKFYQQQHDNLKTTQALCQQLIFYYGHGDGYLTPGIGENSMTSSDTPLDPENVNSVTFLHAFGEDHIDKMLTNDNPLDPNYGKEQAIVLRPTNSGSTIDKNGNQTPNNPELQPVVIDHTRYWHIALDKFVGDETGTSVLTRCQEQLKAVDIALETTGKMLREFTFKFYKSDQLMAEGDDEFQRDKREISQVLNTEAMAFGHSQDSIEKVQTPTSGIDMLYTYAWQQLCAACGIPKSVLLGEQAGTLAGASQDVINYYDGIKSIQTNLLKPEIEQITRLLMYANGDDPDALNWKIVFNPLQSLDDKTQSEVFLNTANALNTLVTSGIVAPDEAQQMLQGQDTNNVAVMQTTGDSLDLVDEKQVEKHYQSDKKKVTSHEQT